MSANTNYSEFLQKKHRMFFKYLDLNGDGKLFRSDILKRVDKMAAMNVANEEESVYTKKCWMRFCDIAFPMIDAENGITEDGFVDMIKSFRSSEDQKKELDDITVGIYGCLFDRLDANRDGSISRDELKGYYGALGSADDTFIDRVFRKLDENKDGLVSKSELVSAGLAFWTSEDKASGYEIMYEVHN